MNGLEVTNRSKEMKTGGYTLYVGATFRVGSGVTQNVYVVLWLSETQVEYKDLVSGFPRINSIQNFINFLTLMNARQEK